MQTNLPIVTASGVFDSQKEYPDNLLSPKRSVTAFEIELFETNSGTSFIDGVPHEIKRGNLLIAKPGMIRNSRLPFRCFFIHFTTNDPAILSLLNKLPAFIDGDHYEKLRGYFSSPQLLFPLDTLGMLIQQARNVLSLLCAINTISFSGYPNHTSYQKNDAIIELAMDFMIKNYDKPIRVEDIARYCNSSTSHFHKRFLAATGITPNQYLNQLRIAAAKKMLNMQSFSLAQIAEQTGFSTQSYFCSCFKKFCGITPKAYRQKMQYRL